MVLFGRYLWLELKRGVRTLRKTIGNFILMIALLVASVTTVSHTLMQSQVFQRIEVGVVVPGEDAMTQTVIQFYIGDEK